MLLPAHAVAAYRCGLCSYSFAVIGWPQSAPAKNRDNFYLLRNGVATACGPVTELTERYGTYFFTHRQFAWVKILAKRYGAECNGGNQALVGTMDSNITLHILCCMLFSMCQSLHVAIDASINGSYVQSYIEKSQFTCCKGLLAWNKTRRPRSSATIHPTDQMSMAAVYLRAPIRISGAR